MFLNRSGGDCVTKKILAVAKIFIAINIIAAIILSAGVFYWNHVYDKSVLDAYTNGKNYKKTFSELLEVMYFSDSEDYKEASLKFLDEDKAVYDNYKLQTDVTIRWIMPATEIKIETQIDGNISIGFIEIYKDTDCIEYKYYRVCDNDIIKTYLLVNDTWYVTKENGKNVALDVNAIIKDLRQCNYEKWPGPCVDYGEATLYPSESLFDYINICHCGSIGSLASKDIAAEDFSDVVNMAICVTDNQQIADLVDCIKEHDYKCDIVHAIDNIGKVNVSLPEDLDEIAIEGNVYEIIMTALVNSAIDDQNTT
jgi:hypothetical protein